MFKKLITTFMTTAVLFTGASFAGAGSGCGQFGYKATKATESDGGVGTSSIVGSQSSADGSSLASSGGEESSVGLDAAIVQGTSTSEQ